MAKIILRGNQEANLIWALELARSTYDGMESDMEGWKDIDNLLAAINRQLNKWGNSQPPTVDRRRTVRDCMGAQGQHRPI